MDVILAAALVTAAIFCAALPSAKADAARHRSGMPVQEIRARIAEESQRTFVPLRGW